MRHLIPRSGSPLFLMVFLALQMACMHAAPRPEIIRIMPVGDSITEGGASFSNYRYPLWERLFTAGYTVEYVGSRKSESRIGPLCHEGYGGKNAGFLAGVVVGNFRQHPADIVLLHAGHNYFANDRPVPEIIAAHESMISGFRTTNPRVTILLAQPIPSGKLPKYSYIPELHTALTGLARKLNRPDSPVIIVPQGRGFSPATDTIADQVHPNERGAAKMADRWFEALTQVLEKPAHAYQPEIVTYKTNPKGDLKLHVFAPAKRQAAAKSPAIVCFFGGGWKVGTPLQFYPECAHFAARGIVAIAADYRIAATHGTSPFEAVADAKSAIRWLRQHAANYGIDPDKIVAAGASAGGHLAAATGSLPGLDDPNDDPSIRAAPNAAILWYPVLDNGPDGYGDAALKSRYRSFLLSTMSAPTRRPR